MTDSKVTLLEGVIEDSFAEKIPLVELKRKDGNIWYIHHHSVYKHKNQEKVRVIFDCSAQFHGTSLKDDLLQGPNFTNNLVYNTFRI